MVVVHGEGGGGIRCTVMVYMEGCQVTTVVSPNSFRLVEIRLFVRISAFKVAITILNPN